MIGARVQIIGTEFDGLVVGKLQRLGCTDEYEVKYADHSGPQKRWFSRGDISFDDREADIVSLLEVTA